jgi:hypothetical protein
MAFVKSDNNIFFYSIDTLLDGINYVITNILPEKEIITEYSNYMKEIKITSEEKDLLKVYDILEVPVSYLYVRNQLEKYQFQPQINTEQKHFYKLYFYIILPNDTFIKLVRASNNFMNWSVRTFELFTFLLDLYVNNVENLTYTAMNKYNFSLKNKITEDELLDAKKDLSYFYDLIIKNLSPYDLKINILHIELYDEYLNKFINSI